jgi:hypothetical protein
VFWCSLDGGSTWTRFQAGTLGSTSIFASTATVILGGSTNAGSGPTARYNLFEIRSTIAEPDGAGAVVATEPDDGPTILTISGEDDVTGSGVLTTAGTFTASTGQTVTITGSGVLTAMTPIIYDGTTSVVVSNDLEAMINDVRLARAGGTQQLAEDALSIGRWKRRITFARSDLLNSDDSDVLLVAEAIRDRRSNVTLRPAGLSVQHVAGSPYDNMPALLTVDIGDLCVVTLPGGTRRVRAAVASINHGLSIGAGTTDWMSSFGFDVFSEVM